MILPPEASGIYRLYLKGICVYVGQSTEMGRRVKNHRRHKEFDEVRWKECLWRDLKSEEQSAIDLYQPALNKQRRAGCSLLTRPSGIRNFERCDEKMIVKKMRQTAKKERVA